MELEHALQHILSAVPATRPETVPLRQAHGRFLARTMVARLPLPPFDNSAMDGYAVRAAEVAGATRTAPSILRLIGQIPAGQPRSEPLPSGACARVYTGSPLPPGADAVVMQEDTLIDPAAPGTVAVCASVSPGEYVRQRGEDLVMGAPVGHAGERVTAARQALLGAAGWDCIEAGCRPAVGILATGTELVDSGKPLAAGKIYESNRVMLAALAEAAGARPTPLPLVADNLEATRNTLVEALETHDIVVSSGGVSVGDFDLVKKAFELAGGRLEFWRVAMKPGRPFVFGRFGSRLFFGLPGNPVSAFVTFLLLVRPALLRWQGAAALELESHPGTLADPLENEGARRHFMRVRVDPDGTVRTAGLQESHVLSALATANGLVDVPPGTALPAGAQVKVLRF